MISVWTKYLSVPEGPLKSITAQILKLRQTLFDLKWTFLALSSILFGFSGVTKDIPSTGNKVKEKPELGQERSERGINFYQWSNENG